MAAVDGRRIHCTICENQGYIFFSPRSALPGFLAAGLAGWLDCFGPFAHTEEEFSCSLHYSPGECIRNRGLKGYLAHSVAFKYLPSTFFSPPVLLLLLLSSPELIRCWVE